MSTENANNLPENLRPPQMPPAPIEKKQNPVKLLFERPEVQQKFKEVLGKKATSFITSVLQVVAGSTDLSRADPLSIYNSAAVAATLDLPINPNLGFAYILPYNQKQKDGTYKTIAQFQIGYKGFIQLAQRSGQFKSISTAPIYDGQIIDANPLDGYKFDFKIKGTTVIGYAAKFTLLNGFEAVNYMSIEQLTQHGKSFSQTFKKGFGLWKDNFDAMASKTVLKLLLSKFAPLSVDMVQQAVIVDQALLQDDSGQLLSYPDNEPQIAIDKELERETLLINDSKTIEELIAIKEQLTPASLEAYEARFEALTVEDVTPEADKKTGQIKLEKLK